MSGSDISGARGATRHGGHLLSRRQILLATACTA